jgi:serine protease Do
MTARPTVRGALSARRIILLTTISGVAAAALFVGVGIKLDRPSISSAYAAENAMRPAGFADLVAKVKPSVISVRAKMEADAKTMSFDGNRPNPQIEQFFRRFGMPDGGNMPEERRQLRPTTGQGSGFFITADGYAVTNHHVVARAKSLEVSTDDGKTYSAKVIGSDPRTDLALIKVDGRNDFPYVKFSDRAARVGDWVVAVGNPFGLGGTVTAGIVSARGRDIGMGPYDDFIQIDAPINKGNSGGPTFDMDGNVIGINTAIYSPSGGNVGIAFGVPAEIAKPVVAQLKDKGVVSRGWIGVNIQPVTDEIAENLEQPGRQGRRAGRRRHHRGQRRRRQGRKGPRAADRRSGARRSGEARRVAQGRDQDLLADARRNAEGAAGARRCGDRGGERPETRPYARARRAGRRQQLRGRGGRQRRTQRACRRARLQDR